MAAALDPHEFDSGLRIGARVLSQHLSFIQREGLDNFEREITIYNSSLRGLDQARNRKYATRLGTVPSLYIKFQLFQARPSTSRARLRAEQNRGPH
jgi:hypothetical protein